jgi:hypothetical protein
MYTLSEIPGHYSGLHPVAANAVIETGGLVALNAAGFAVPASSSVTGHVVGRSTGEADNTGGANGDLVVTPKRGIFGCANSATAPVDVADVGQIVFAEAPDIIRKTGTCRAGLLVGFDGDGRPLVDTRLSTLATAAEVAAAIDAIP